MPEMGIREYARHRGVPHQSVSYAVKTGRIQKNAKGRIDSAQADRDWKAKTDAGRVAAGKMGGRPRQPNPTLSQPRRAKASPALPGSEAAAPGSTGHNSSQSYAKSRADREHYNALKAKLEYEEKTRQLLPADQVHEATRTLFRRLRDAVDNLPSRLAAQLAAEPSADAVFNILQDEIHLIFGNFADGKFS